MHRSPDQQVEVTLRNAAKHQQRQRRRLPAAKHGCKQCGVLGERTRIHDLRVWESTVTALIGSEPAGQLTETFVPTEHESSSSCL